MISAQRLLEELKRRGVTHLVGLPDNSSAPLFSLLQGNGDVRLIAVTREGEAFALAAGLWMGGKTPALLIQNTGLLESGDALRGTVSRMRIPLLCLITYRGFKSLKSTSSESAEMQPPFSPNLLSRPDVDSTALVTEPTLRAWGIPYFFLKDDQGLAGLDEAVEEAERLSHPVAVLITEGMK
ncbi:MAG: thiamine pyrophosphate-binding protein [Acidobacteriia bacterium]|nr:thiamine pyrophosphate-binding protein [Terriglobia bacterium]